jgi:hypothetical protein
MSESLNMSAVLGGYARANNCTFILAGQPVEPEELFGESFMLPVVTVQAQAKAMRLLGNGLSCMVREDKEALLDARAEVPEFSFGRVSDLVRALFFMNAAERVFGIRRGGLIDCTPVYQYFKRPLSERAAMTEKSGVEWPLAKPAR